MSIYADRSEMSRFSRNSCKKKKNFPRKNNEILRIFRTIILCTKKKKKTLWTHFFQFYCVCIIHSFSDNAFYIHIIIRFEFVDRSITISNIILVYIRIHSRARTSNTDVIYVKKFYSIFYREISNFVSQFVPRQENE